MITPNARTLLANRTQALEVGKVTISGIGSGLLHLNRKMYGQLSKINISTN